MQVGINGRIVSAKVVSRGASSAPGCSSRHFPILVSVAGVETWVYSDEIDSRKIPTDIVAMRSHDYLDFSRMSR